MSAVKWAAERSKEQPGGILYAQQFTPEQKIELDMAGVLWQEHSYVPPGTWFFTRPDAMKPSWVSNGQEEDASVGKVSEDE